MLHDPLHTPVPVMKESAPEKPLLQVQAGALLALVGQDTSWHEGDPVQLPSEQVNCPTRAYPELHDGKHVLPCRLGTVQDETLPWATTGTAPTHEFGMQDGEPLHTPRRQAYPLESV